MDRLLRWAASVPVPARRAPRAPRDFLRLAAALVLGSLLVGTVVALVLLT